MVNHNRPLSPPANTSINTSSSSSSTNANQQSLLCPSIQSSTKNFCDNFWGDKATGFDALCQNLKHSLTSAKDLEQFLREASSVEDQHARSLNKLVSVINKSSTNGSFHPTWSLLRDLNEKYSATHANMVQSLHELIRDVQKYADDLSKKIKRIRENEQQTQLVVQSFQECSSSLNKAKDQYHNLCSEFDKLKRQLDPQQLVQYQTMSQQQTSASNLMSLVPGANSTSLNTTLTTSRVSQLVKVEKKMKQACDDYKSSIEKYNMVRVDYERKLADSCNQFQYAEEGHLKQMRNYVESYSKIVASGNSQKCQIMADLTAKMESLSSEYLISLFIDNKRTGIERPEVAQFVESPVNTPNVTTSTIDNDLPLNENEYKNIFQTSYSQLNGDKNQSPVQNNESKKNDSKGLNIFNVDFLTGRNRNKKSHSKNQKKQAQSKPAAAAAFSASSSSAAAAATPGASQADETKSGEDKSLNSLSLDLFDHLKISDVDSEGYSLRPDSSIDLRPRTNDDMNNYVSSPSSSESESDSDEQPVKVMLKIKPKHEQSSVQNMDVLREISKNLQLQKPASKVSKQHSKTYQYTFSGESSMTRSVSMGSNLQADLNKSESSLFDMDFSPKAKIANENSLYNIDEDKEVESSFQYSLAIKKPAVSSSPAGRFTPACFPGRTTPDFRHTTSLFEQQSTRASIISPLTVNAGSEIIPIAIAFNETIHAYFKIGEPSRSKIKCFGCMKISFPYAILKLLSLELPLLQFNLKNLSILNQDLKLNTQLLEKDDAMFTDMDEFNFRFKSQHLVSELKAQHQVNKMAAFFNFELLKYEFRYLKEEAPMVLEANWSCDRDQQTVELVLDYRLTCAKSLGQCSFMVLMPMAVVVGAKEFRVSLESSEPRALVNRQEKEERTQVLFQVGCVSMDGKVSAKFRVSEASGDKLGSLEQLYQPVYTKFHIDNDTLSTVKFKISSGNYKLSLLKERVESGKYFCDYDPQQSASGQRGASRSQITAGSISTLIGSTVDLLN